MLFGGADAGDLQAVEALGEGLGVLGEGLGVKTVGLESGVGDLLMKLVGDGLADLLPPTLGGIDGPGERAERLGRGPAFPPPGDRVR